MGSDLAARGAKGGAIALAGQAGKLGIQLASVIILSRLLAPEDFGLVAMVTVFVGLGELVRDFGMPTAALQARTLTQQQASNFFWANSILGFSASAVLALSTPLVVQLYDEPRLSGVMPTLALAPLLNGVQAQIQVRLARSMRYGALAVTDVVSQATGLVMAILAALCGLDYWSLVVQMLTAAVLLLITRWFITRWIPRRPLRGHGSRTQFTSGSYFGLAQLLTYAASNADTLTIGARFGATSTGYYNRAFQLLTLPINGLMGPLTQVVVPLINAARTEGKAPFDVLIRVQQMLSLPAVWVFVVTAATADSLIPLTLGDEWTSSIRLFQILAVGGAVQVFSFVSYWGFITMNQGRELLFYNMVTKTLSIVFILVGSSFGLTGVAWGYAIGLTVAWPINLLWLRKTAKLPAARFFLSGAQVLGAAILSFVSGYGVVVLTPWSPGLGDLFVGALVSTLVYLALILIVPEGRRILKDAVSLAGRALRRK